MNEWTALSMNKNMIHLLHKLEVMLQSAESNIEGSEACIARLMESVQAFRNSDTAFTVHDVSIQFTENNTKYRINSFRNDGIVFDLHPPITGSVNRIEEESKEAVTRTSNFKSIARTDKAVDRTLQDTSNRLYHDGCIMCNRGEGRDDFFLKLFRDYQVMKKYDDRALDMLSYHIYLKNPDDKTVTMNWIDYINSRLPDGAILKK